MHLARCLGPHRGLALERRCGRVGDIPRAVRSTGRSNPISASGFLLLTLILNVPQPALRTVRYRYTRACNEKVNGVFIASVLDSSSASVSRCYAPRLKPLVQARAFLRSLLRSMHSSAAGSDSATVCCAC